MEWARPRPAAMRSPFTVLLATSLFVSLLSGAALADSLTVPGGKAITLDGTIDSAEWTGALVVQLSDSGGSIRLLHDGSFLYVGVASDSGSYPHLAVMSPGTVRILHASAALGSAEYMQANSTRWDRQTEFKWEMRDTTLSESARTERADHIDRRGWVASTVGMGRPGETEYIIHLELFDQTPLRLAAAAGTGGEPPHFWPAALNDGVRSQYLFLGNAPRSLSFDVKGWASLRLGPVRKP